LDVCKGLNRGTCIYGMGDVTAADGGGWGVGGNKRSAADGGEEAGAVKRDRKLNDEDVSTVSEGVERVPPCGTA
jgi:hypothetical protein